MFYFNNEYLNFITKKSRNEIMAVKLRERFDRLLLACILVEKTLNTLESDKSARLPPVIPRRNELPVITN